VSRIFVIHPSKDNRQAVALRAWLVAQDPPLANEIFLDTDPGTNLKPGVKWKNELVSANSRCEAVICLLSNNWESSVECLAEYRTAENLGKQMLCAHLQDGTGRHTSEWQGCPELRWAAFEAAKCAARRGSPDCAYYHKLAAKRDGHNGKNPTLAVERKILRRCYHTLHELGDAALALPDTQPRQEAAA